ncbi:VOC family protein [Streptomyces spiramenti]|uniref:VOC family protein n=1 Tax=Streptomyces spiramenti TaxID=2720606 RepID=A0ABX1AN42_9ACTN|nr:VOC family protein [Streptomyces spiramenti]NJP68514.1 VOC family protein [Streptomyces spiramenti]
MAVATLGAVVLDCPDPRELAAFYSAVLGWSVDPGSDDDWVEIVGPHDQRLGFQRVEDHRPPRWPDPAHPQQLHLDFEIPQGTEDEAERRVIELGAVLLAGNATPTSNFRVYADPVGHPFCLCAH